MTLDLGVSLRLCGDSRFGFLPVSCLSSRDSSRLVIVPFIQYTSVHYRFIRCNGLYILSFIPVFALIVFPKKKYKKGRHKDKTPTNDILRKKVTAVILGILTLLDILVLGVCLKSRSKELELEADIW